MIIHEEYVIAPVSSDGGGGLGGYYFNPSPFVEGENSFGEGTATETAALAMAKAYFNSNPQTETEYNEDPMRMINIHWKDASGTSYSSQYAKVQTSAGVYEWSKLNFGGSINLANHDFVELRDGQTWIDQIKWNEEKVYELQHEIDLNHGLIEKNATDIATNKAEIAANANRINVNESNIDDLKKKVNTNIANIATNTGEIVKLHAKDQSLQDQIDEIKSGESDFAIGAKNLGPVGLTYPILKEAFDDRKVVGQGLVPNGQFGIHPLADGGLRLSTYGQFVGVFATDTEYEDFFIGSDLPRAAVTCAILKSFVDRTVDPAVHRHNVFVQRQGSTITIVPISGELLWDDAHARTSHQVKEIGVGQGLTPAWDMAKGKLSLAVDPSIISSSSVPTFIVKKESSTVPKNSGYLFDLQDGVSEIVAALPEHPEDGDWVIIGDYNGKCNPKRHIKISSSSPIHGSNQLLLNQPNAVVVLSYIDEDIGWKIVDGIGFIQGARSAFRFDPAIPMEGKNKFAGNSYEQAEQARDAWFNTPAKLKPYDDDPYLLIELSLKITNTLSRPIYQCRAGNIWIEAFSGNMVMSQKNMGGTLKPLRTIRFEDHTGAYDDHDYTVSLKGVRAKLKDGDSYGINNIIISSTGDSSVTTDGTLTIATSSGVTADKILSLIDTDTTKSNVHIAKDTSGKLTFNVDAAAIGLTADKIVELTNTGKDITAKVEDGKVTFEIDDTQLLNKLRKDETVESDSGLLRNSATVEVDRAKIGGVDQIKFHSKLTALTKEGVELKKFNRVQAGSGVVISKGKDSMAGEDIIIEVDPNFSGMTAKTSNDTEFKNITKIDVLGDKPMASTDEDGELTINIQSNMLNVAKATDIAATYPPASNPHRLCYASDTKQMFVSDGAAWALMHGRAIFLGIHDRQVDLFNAAKGNNILFRKNQTHGYVRKGNSIGGTSKTIYHRMWKWNSDLTEPTVTEIEDETNWNKDDAWSAYGQNIVLVGIGTEYTDWSPESIDKNPMPKDHVGQFIYYNTTDKTKVGHYYSDGSKWNYGHGPDSALTPNNFMALVDGTGNVSVTKTTVEGKPKLKFDYTGTVDNAIDVDGYNESGTFETFPSKEKITFDENLITKSDGSDGVEVKYRGLTVSGINEGLSPTEYKGVQSIAIDGSHHVKSFDTTTGKLDLKLGIVLMGESTADEYLDVGALRLKGGTIKSETLSGRNYYTYEPTESIFHGSVNGGTAEHITQIDVYGDAAIVGKKMTVKAEKTLFVADTETNLNANFAPKSYKNRLGLTTENDTIYLSTKRSYEDDYDWSKIASKDHFSDVDSLNLRFPKRVPKTDTYIGDDYKQLRQVFLTSKATATIDLPIQEDGFLYNMYSSDKTETEYGWVQEFHGSKVGGNSWIRRRQSSGSSYYWGDWERIQTSKLEDHNHTVLICDNNDVYKQAFDDNIVMPYMIYQDPTSNLITEEKSRFKFIRPGLYNVEFYSQFTWKEYPTGTSDIVESLDHYTFEVARVTKSVSGETFTTVGQIKVDNVTWDTTTLIPKKLFPMVKGVVKDVNITAADIANPNISFAFRISVGNKTQNMMKQMSIDPYKNMVAVDPVVSKCKTAANVIGTLYRSLGGISFQPGYEVRSQEPATGTTPRVFGDTYSNNVIG